MFEAEIEEGRANHRSRVSCFGVAKTRQKSSPIALDISVISLHLCWKSNTQLHILVYTESYVSFPGTLHIFGNSLLFESETRLMPQSCEVNVRLQSKGRLKTVHSLQSLYIIFSTSGWSFWHESFQKCVNIGYCNTPLRHLPLNTSDCYCDSSEDASRSTCSRTYLLRTWITVKKGRV